MLQKCFKFWPLDTVLILDLRPTKPNDALPPVALTLPLSLEEWCFSI